MNVVFLDVETQRSFDEVGGRHNIRRMGLAAAVTYSTASGTFRHYTEDGCDELLAELRAADLVVGFNLLGFDYEVLRAYTHDPLDDLPTVDMLDQVYRGLGFRIGLNALAECTLGRRKSADGLQSLAWYREGKIQEVLDYCQQDVEVTRQLYEYGRQYKHLKYRDRSHRIQVVPVSW